MHGSFHAGRLSKAKAAFLSKDVKKTDQPLEYRTLLILPTIYRRWALARLGDLKPWIREWETDGMNAGVEGTGAEDAWGETALTIEQCKITNAKYTGGASDIYTCFDQLPRSMVYHMAHFAGIPDPILTAYCNFQENLETQNAIGGRTRKCTQEVKWYPAGLPFLHGHCRTHHETMDHAHADLHWSSMLQFSR